MIKRIFVSETDRSNLSQSKTIQDPGPDYFNYKGIVVNKPWGYEYLMFENDYVAIWMLHLKKDHATSMHCHPRKRASMIVISGKVLASTLNQWFELSHLDGLIYEEGVFHTSKALSDDTMIMEIETPPIKKDLVRLKDNYGRENKGYEGKSQFSKELKSYKHIFFEKKEIKQRIKKKINNTIISFSECTSDYLHNAINGGNKKLYSILEEKVIDHKHKFHFGVGNIFDESFIKEYKDVRIFKNCLLLMLERV